MEKTGEFDFASRLFGPLESEKENKRAQSGEKVSGEGATGTLSGSRRSNRCTSNKACGGKKPTKPMNPLRGSPDPSSTSKGTEASGKHADTEVMNDHQSAHFQWPEERY